MPLLFFTRYNDIVIMFHKTGTTVTIIFNPTSIIITVKLPPIIFMFFLLLDWRTSKIHLFMVSNVSILLLYYTFPFIAISFHKVYINIIIDSICDILKGPSIRLSVLNPSITALISPYPAK